MTLAGFPLCSVDSDVKKALLELLKKSTDQSVEMLFCYCITKMIEELQQGLFNLPFYFFEICL